MSVTPTWQLASALVALLLVAIAASRLGQLGLQKRLLTAAIRAVIQLAAVSLVIAAALAQLWSALAFALLMFVVAVITSSKRSGVAPAWPWVAVALGAGVLPSAAIIFAFGVVPLAGVSIIPILGIIIGNAMNANSLALRLSFGALREQFGAMEGGLALGLTPAQAAAELIDPRLPDALISPLDQTRTVGLVTLPGAFIGVLLGGGTAVQAGAAQILVLIGLLCADTLTVSTARALIQRGKLLPQDLRDEHAAAWA